MTRSRDADDDAADDDAVDAGWRWLMVLVSFDDDDDVEDDDDDDGEADGGTRMFGTCAVSWLYKS